MRRIISEYAGLIITEVLFVIMIVIDIIMYEKQSVLWLFVIMLLVAGMYFMDYASRKLIESSEAVRAKCDELRKRNDEQGILIKNLMTENGELRRKLSRKRPKTQTEEKSDE